MNDNTVEPLPENKKKEIAAALGLDDLPRPRYDDLPKQSPDAIKARVNFQKALEVVDPIATAAFARFIPPKVVIDQGLDARTFKADWSFLIHCDPSVPLAVNRKITAATGIGAEPTEPNIYMLLAQKLQWVWDETGARGCSPPLVCRSRGEKRGNQCVVPPLLGIIVKLDRTPKDGMTMEQMGATLAVMHDRDLKTKSRVIPVETVPTWVRPPARKRSA